MRRHHLTVTLLVLISVLPNLVAQTSSGMPRPFLPGTPSVKPALNPEAQATIQRSLSDLASDDAGIRSGAVMLLSKYRTDASDAAVVAALSDPSAQVRRAAVVSHVEWGRSMPPEAISKLFEMLDDPDVEVRRDVSSSLMLLLELSRSMRWMQGTFGAANTHDDVLRDAFSDADAIVRANLLKVFPYLRVELSRQQWLSLLNDDAPDVRLLAFPQASRWLVQQEMLPVATKWAQSERREERLLAATYLRGINHPDALNALKQLANDGHQETAAEALLSLLQRSQSPEIAEVLLRRLQQDELSLTQGKRLLLLFGQMPDAIENVVSELKMIDNDDLRPLAIKAFLQHGPPEEVMATMPELADDPVKRVRDQLVNALRDQPRYRTDATLNALLGSRYLDARHAVVRMAPLLEPEQRDLYLVDLLFDPDPEIRAAALRMVVSFQLDGWQAMLEAAIEERSEVMMRATLESILRLPVRAQLPFLNKYIDQHPGHPYGNIAAEARNRIR